MAESENFHIIPGDNASPYILHVPHASRFIPEEVLRQFLISPKELQRELDEVTDTFTDHLAVQGADAAKLRPWLFINALSRLVVDPERFPDEREAMNELGLGAVYRRTSSGEVLRDISKDQEEALLTKYFHPYAQAFEDLVTARLDHCAKVVILDIHSYRPTSHTNSLHKSARRPALCLGTDEFHTPAWLAKQAEAIFAPLGQVLHDEPYVGTYTPLRYFRQEKRVLSLMLEIRADLFLNADLSLAPGSNTLIKAIATLVDENPAPTLLTAASVPAYLVERAIVTNDADVVIEILTGGISNVVFGVQCREKDYVLKQALPELLVSSTWKADQRRSVVEAEALQEFHRMTPTSVPRLVDLDPESFTLLLERAPRASTVWKEELLKGRADLEIAKDLGAILGRWHRLSALNHEVLERFTEDQLFEQLRITPFYRSLQSIYPSVAPRISILIDELQSSHRCLVHGDFSPKNILVSPNRRAIVLDFEVTHSGDPIFDIAFLLAHLLCKYEYFQGPTERSTIAALAAQFISSYTEECEPPAAELSWHVAVLALARVDGVSRVNYLNTEAQESVRKKTIWALSLPEPPDWRELFLTSS